MAAAAVSLPRLYAIADEEIADRLGISLSDLARQYLAGGARLLQIRAKRAAAGQLLVWADEIVRAAREAGARVIVNDRADVARLSGADGVHVGQEDLPVDAARRVTGADALVGVSTHTIAQVEDASRTSADYLAVGPIYGTVTKDTGYAPVGLSLVRAAVARAGGRPVVAIGGITLARAPEVLDAGAAAVAVIGDLASTGDPARRLREWVSALR